MEIAEQLLQYGIKVATGKKVAICTDEGEGCTIKVLHPVTLDGERTIAGPEDVDYFAAPDQTSEFHDPELADLADKLNALLREANAKRPDPHAKLGLFSSGQGFVPIWKYEDPATMPELVAGSIQTLSDTVLWPK